MSDLFWLSQAQMRRIEPYFPLSHGVPRVDDRCVISGIIFVIRHQRHWRCHPLSNRPPSIGWKHYSITSTCSYSMDTGSFTPAAKPFPVQPNLIERYGRRGIVFSPSETYLSLDFVPGALGRFPREWSWGVIAQDDRPIEVLGENLARVEGAPDRFNGFLYLTTFKWREEDHAGLTACLARAPRPVIAANPDVPPKREGQRWDTTGRGDFGNRRNDSP